MGLTGLVAQRQPQEPDVRASSLRWKGNVALFMGSQRRVRQIWPLALLRLPRGERGRQSQP